MKECSENIYEISEDMKENFHQYVLSKVYKSPSSEVEFSSSKNSTYYIALAVSPERISSLSPSRSAYIYLIPETEFKSFFTQSSDSDDPSLPPELQVPEYISENCFNCKSSESIAELTGISTKEFDCSTINELDTRQIRLCSDCLDTVQLAIDAHIKSHPEFIRFLL